MSDTPLTDRHPLWHGEPAVHIDFARKLERDVYEAEREIKDLTIRAQLAEKERDSLRELALQLAKELAFKCGDPVHKHQVSELHEVADFFKYRPQPMCTSSLSQEAKK